MDYPFKLEFSEDFKGILKMPDVITLAAVKASALRRRAKWKDYVDLYFVIGKFSLGKVAARAKVIFGNEFNEKLFREQLAYFKDIDYSEEIDYMEGYLLPDSVIRDKLTEFSLEK